MNMSSRPVRILLIETDSSLSALAGNILQATATCRMFHFTAVPNLNEAFREINKESPDILLIDIDPDDEPELGPLCRLHEYAAHTPIVALLDDRHQTSALALLQKGAQNYLLKSQMTEEALPAFLLRTLERHAAHIAVRESEERFRLMIENASDVILILDKAGVITYASPSTDHVLKRPPSDLVGANALDYLHRDDRASFLDKFEKAFEPGQTLPMVGFRLRGPEGTWIHMEGKGRVTQDSSGRSLCIMNSRDVSHRVQLEEELRSLALRDELTGLHNRRSFVTVLEQQFKLAQRTKDKGIHLLFIDLDGFKGINDTLGHKEGDRALREASYILKTTFRDADLVARLGGDEFVVFLTDDVNELNVDGLKSRLNAGVDEWNNKEQRAYRLAMSVGVVRHDPAAHRTVEDLLRHADELMYEQKRAKKGAAALRN